MRRSADLALLDGDRRDRVQERLQRNLALRRALLRELEILVQLVVLLVVLLRMGPRRILFVAEDAAEEPGDERILWRH